MIISATLKIHIRPALMLYLGCLLFLCGCSLTGSWKTVNQTGPWISPSERAITIQRCNTFYGSSSVDWESVWVINRFRKIDHNKLADKSIQFLIDSGFANDWPEKEIMNWKPKISPYRFFIISLNPTITVMVPKYDDLNLPFPLERDQSIHSRLILDKIGYGTLLPKSDSARWFSHELKILPQLIGSDRIIDLPNIKLKCVQFKQYENVLEVKRFDK